MSRKRALGQEKEHGIQREFKMDSHRDLTTVSHFLRQKIASFSL
jgi:hypothetical protein